MTEHITQKPTSVAVTWREISSEGKEFIPSKAAIIFPGWPLNAESKSIQTLVEVFAGNFDGRTYVIDTRSEHIIPDSLLGEAQVTCKSLLEKEIEHVILIGYSQGGIKAINTTVLLQQTDSAIHVDGLILIDPVGLDEVDGMKLVRSYIIDSLIISPIVILKEVARRSSLQRKLKALGDSIVFTFRVYQAFLLALTKEIRLSKLAYLSRFNNELKEMSMRNPYLQEIKVPIVLILGNKDRVSDPKAILTHARNQPMKAEMQSTLEYLFTHHNDRKEYNLAEALFPQSPYVGMIKAQKYGSHLLPLFRSKSVAQASLYLLQRSERCLGIAGE